MCMCASVPCVVPSPFPPIPRFHTHILSLRGLRPDEVGASLFLSLTRMRNVRAHDTHIGLHTVYKLLNPNP